MKTKELVLKRAERICCDILSSTVSPAVGCNLLANLCENHGWPTELTTFSALAHEQSGHEQFGFDSNNTDLLIIEACRSFLESPHK
jgi:hypothetical protein